MHVEFSLVNQKGRDKLGDPTVEGRVLLKWNIKIYGQDVRVWTLVLFMVRVSCWLLGTWYRTSVKGMGHIIVMIFALS
jgi:hypothetical protein